MTPWAERETEIREWKPGDIYQVDGLTIPIMVTAEGTPDGRYVPFVNRDGDLNGTEPPYLGKFLCNLTDIAACLARIKELEKENALRKSFMDRLPFCPDHRDKVAGKPCRECRIEVLEGVSARYRQELDDRYRKALDAQ